MSKHVSLTAVGTIILAASRIASADVSWSVGAGVAHTDNAARVSTAETTDTIASVGGGIDLDFEGSRIDASLVGNGTFQRYLDDTFDDDFAGSLRGNLAIGLIEDRFIWIIEDTFGQVASVPFAAITPVNRNNVNILSTGPNLATRLGDAGELQANGRLRQSTYGSDVRPDDTAVSGQLTLARRMSQQTKWSVTAAASRVEYDLPGDPGYDMQNLYATIAADGARQTLSLDLGASRVSDNSGSSNNPLVRLNWNRRMTPSWTLDVKTGIEYRDTTDRFVNAIADPGASGTSSVALSNVPAETTFARLGVGYNGPRVTFQFGANVTRENYEGASALDRDEMGFYAEASRRFSERVTGNLRVALSNRDFRGISLSDTYRETEASLDWRAGRRLHFALGYRNSSLDAVDPLLDFDESIAFLNVSVRSGDKSAYGGPIF